MIGVAIYVLNIQKEKVVDTESLARFSRRLSLGIGLVGALIWVGAPYVLFYDSLPVDAKLWLSPQIVLVVAFVVGLGVSAAAKMAFLQKQQLQKQQLQKLMLKKEQARRAQVLRTNQAVISAKNSKW